MEWSSNASRPLAGAGQCQDQCLESWLEATGFSADSLQAMGLEAGEVAEGLHTILTTCRDAWQAGLVQGFNGNMSVRLGEAENPPVFLVTGTGTAKGHLRPDDISLCREGELVAGRPLSSETPMHTAVYAARPKTRCLLHLHPEHLLALYACLTRDMPKAGSSDAGQLCPGFLELPFFEAAVWRQKLGFAGAIAPGTQELANAVGQAFAGPGVQAVFMAGHGLCVAGSSGVELLGLCEQYEHLARIQLTMLQTMGPGSQA